jgi:hypothetical protein
MCNRSPLRPVSNRLENRIMSHKARKSLGANAAASPASRASEDQSTPVPRSPETKASAQPKQEESGPAWQVIFIIAGIVGGLLLLLGKALGLF